MPHIHKTFLSSLLPAVLISASGLLLVPSTPTYAQAPTSVGAAIRPATIKRVAGWWTFNESLFVESSAGPAAPTVVLTGLKRGGKTKFPQTIASKTGAPVRWSTIPLPSLEVMAAPGYDFAALTARLRADVASGNLGQVVGYSLQAGMAPAGSLNPAQKGAALTKVRTAVEAVSPGAAIILWVDASKASAAEDLDDLAPGCDAVLLQVSGRGTPEENWNLKVARKIVEEQPNYDLPLFVSCPSYTNPSPSVDKFLLDCFMGGATGFVLPSTVRPAWAGVMERNFVMLPGAVTLEDAPFPNQPATIRLANLIRSTGRIPLMGRLPLDDKGKGEPLMVMLDSSTNVLTLDAVKRAASQGATMYIEGLPNIAEPAVATRLSELTGTTITPLAKPVTNVVSLQDPWMFGTGRGLEMPVLQSVTVKPKPSLAAQANNQRGLDKLTAARFVATLADDPGGMVVYGVGKGRVVWLPHALDSSQEPALRLNPKLTTYYSSIAGLMQGALVRLRPTREAAPNPRVALRLTKGKTALLALFNDSNTPLTTNVASRGLAEIVVDLETGQELKVTKRGYETQYQVTVPANGWSLLALNDSKKDFERDKAGKVK